MVFVGRRAWCAALILLACSDDVAGDAADSTTTSSSPVGSSSDAGSSTTSVDVCEPSPTRGVWEELAPMTIGRTGHTATLLSNGDTVVVGGRACVTTDDLIRHISVERYSFDTGSWTELAQLASARTDHAAIALEGDRVLVLGGTTDDGSASEVLQYDAVTDLWSVVGLLPVAAEHPTIVRLGPETLMLLDFAWSRSAWTISDDGGESWLPITAPSNHGYPEGERALVALPDGRAVYAATGFTTVYDPATDAWTDVPAGFEGPWAGGAAALSADEVLLMGSRWADEQFSVGTTQYSPWAAILRWVDDDVGYDLGFVACPIASGKVEHFATRMYGASLDLVVVQIGSWYVVYDGEEGWANLGAIPIRADESTALMLDDGSLLVTGGIGEGACESANAVQRWSP